MALTPMVCGMWRPSRPSYGYSPRCGRQSAKHKAAEAIAELITDACQIPHPGPRIGDRHPGVRHRVDN